jgi:putative RNA 2'-phosphotransferase
MVEKRSRPLSRLLSRLLSYVLRHHPGEYGLVLGDGGWVAVDALLLGLLGRGHRVTRAELLEVVRTNDKQRFSLSPDGSQIRANQGHSVSVNLMLLAQMPPSTLYHGTIAAALAAIREQGLSSMSRNHVHLSAERSAARGVGARRGQPLILEVTSGAMHAAGHVFYRSENGVWLTQYVPPEFIRFPNSA